LLHLGNYYETSQKMKHPKKSIIIRRFFMEVFTKIAFDSSKQITSTCTWDIVFMMNIIIKVCIYCSKKGWICIYLNEISKFFWSLDCGHNIGPHGILDITLTSGLDQCCLDISKILGMNLDSTRICMQSYVEFVFFQIFILIHIRHKTVMQ
jgi:hypothetical protein